VVMAASFHATTTKYFKFLNVAKEGWQSKLMHKALLEQAKDTPFEKLILNSPTRPYPQITIGYMVGDQKIESSLEFMSLGEGGDATNIFSWRGDWINIEEAGRIDNLNEIVGNLATRLTGVTAEGRSFLARMSLISNPWDNMELWQLMEMAALDAEDGLVFNIDTAANKNVSDKQVKLALKRIPEDQHKRFMTGNRPQARGGYFNGEVVEACESEQLSVAFMKAKDTKAPGVFYEKNSVLGVWYFRTPRRDGRVYMIYGDPGTGAAPARNAPSILVFDVTDAGKLFVPVVAMWWGNGGGSIMPYIDKLLELTKYYKPLEAGSDSTGTQKNTAELMNFDHVIGKGYSITHVLPLSFASSLRYTYLTSLRISLESMMFRWPSFLAKSLSAQLRNYDDAKDRNPNSKLAQDLVATLAMAAYRIRSTYRLLEQANSEEENKTSTKSDRDRRPVDRARTTRRDPRR